MSRILVAVVDSGWRRTEKDPRVLPGVGLVHPEHPLEMLRSDDDDDRNGHGTGCTKLILASAPDAEIFPVRVFGDRLETSVEHLCAALQIATERGARVVNMSLATVQRHALVPLYAACEAARHRGVVIVAAADGRTKSGFPAVFANVIGIRAGPVESPLGYEPSADGVMDFVARVASADSPPSASRPWGTNSYASAVMAGVVARLLSEAPDERPSLDQVRLSLAERSVRDGESAVAEVLDD